MLLNDHCKVVLDLDGSMRYTCVPPVGLYWIISQDSSCGPIIDGLHYPPNRPVTVHDGSFILLPDNRFAVVRLAVLAVT